MHLLAASVLRFIEEHAAEFLGGLVFAFAWAIIQKSIIVRLAKQIAHWLQYFEICINYKLLARFRRLRFSLATLDDYVDLLDELRRA